MFIASDTFGSRKDTATMLVGTAREFGVNQRDIKASASGFQISDALASVLYNEGVLTSSGHRAEKQSPRKGK